MNIELNIPEKITIDKSTLQKMYFIHNALENGWSVKKREEKYIFNKKHENKREVYLDSYLEDFLKSSININENFIKNN
jgi:transposase